MQKRMSRSRAVPLLCVMIVGGIAASYLINRYSENERREAFIYRCNEEGAGGMFTSREYCEELYERSAK